MPPVTGVNLAVSESGLPIGSWAVVSEAAPELTVCGPPMSVLPLRNCTVPVAAEFTVAVKRTDWPTTAGLRFDIKTTLVVAFTT